MLYKVIVYRNDGTKLEMKADDRQTACEIARDYNNKFGYDVAVTETRTILFRMTAQGGFYSDNSDDEEE